MDKKPSGVTHMKLKLLGTTPYDIMNNDEFCNDLFIKNILIRHLKQ
jgi:hypothetical protein